MPRLVALRNWCSCLLVCVAACTSNDSKLASPPAGADSLEVAVGKIVANEVAFARANYGVVSASVRVNSPAIKSVTPDELRISLEPLLIAKGLTLLPDADRQTKNAIGVTIKRIENSESGRAVDMTVRWDGLGGYMVEITAPKDGNVTRKVTARI